ncbi:hypothetical protein K469DRAFT_688611 [Zopfia rhizophila CBS 207.26]|uniref:Uncharacterized protein n=1 Tax=Zopfia rhizophila CBS 207.26 TaxID=1314779 RepID=A0A6A6DY64_9PEZI|nr:hypothetical protein K469DRAFT_688611 [Zopfia rhizophila CBS 207.26]
MASSRYLALYFILLGALSASASAELLGHLIKRTAALSPRQRTCATSGWIPACPGPIPCIPPGGICCSDGISYAMPPDTCPDGTHPIATAIPSNAASATPAPPVSTPPPLIEQTWYTYTITYYYYYYYYTYFAAYSSGLTSSQSTYLTIVSLTATNEAQASSLFNSLSATLSYAVPSQTATPTYGSTPIATATATSAPTSISNGTIPTNTPPLQFTGAATSLRAGMRSSFSGIFVLTAGALMAIPGLLMVWL